MEIKSKTLTKNKINSLHQKLRKENGRATCCENPNCKSIKPKIFEWALRKGLEYSSDPKDYMQLLPSCHRKYDETDERRMKIAKARKGRRDEHLYNQKKVVQFSKMGDEIAIHNSLSDAVRAVGLKQAASITNHINGLTTHAGGYLWKIL
jgi:hypothetical protein